MDSAVGTETEEMELLAGGLDVVVNLGYFSVLLERMGFAGHIDLDKVLVYHAAGAKIHMPDFGVAHLPVRKSYVFAAGLQVRHRIFLAEAVDERSPLGVDCVG